MANKIYTNCKNIIRQILLSQSMTKEDLLCYLYAFCNTGEYFIPIEIKKQKLESKIVDDIIIHDDCISKNQNNILSIKQRCLTKISYDPIKLPFKSNFKFDDIYKGCRYNFCGELVKLTPLYSPEMAKIAPLIPNTSDFGALFTIPENHNLFKFFLPLFQEDNEHFIFEINPMISKTNAYEKFSQVFSIVKNYLIDYVSDCDVEKTLYSFLNVLYPSSICTYKEYCVTPEGEMHTNSLTKSEDYYINSKRIKNNKCSCGRDISFRITKLKSERIKKDLVNGVFNEWYAAKKIEISGLKDILWNTNIFFDNDLEKHFDAIGFNDELIILLECKRIYKINNDFKGAINKLKYDKIFFEDRYPEKKIFVGLLTNIREPVDVPQHVDFHINHNNFLEFEDILKSYV